ncbi:MAG: type IX secretion system sortase PorU [Bacteroidales bacterium]|nr:type IX secretion system sortase PorU [Bacteroidales bacterium]
MKKIFYIILILSLLDTASAQTFFFSDSLSKIGTTEFYTPDSTKIKVIFFENCMNRDFDFFPVYRKTLTAGEGTSISNVSLKNVSYSPIDYNIYKGIYKISEIGNEAEINAKVVKFRKQDLIEFEMMPIRKNPSTGTIEIADHFECEIKVTQTKTRTTGRQYASTSKMASGKWYKIKVSESGIYKLTYAQLTEMGFSNFSSIGIFGYGGMESKTIRDNTPQIFADKYIDDLPERSILKVDANGNGSFDSGDYILFYADGPHNIRYNSNGNFSHDFHNYSDFSYYFVSDRGTWKNATETPSESSSNVTVNTYDKYSFLEKDSISIVKSGRNFFWRSLGYYTTMNESITENNATSDSATVYMHFAAAATTASSFSISINGVSAGRANIQATTSNGNETFFTTKFVPRSNTTNFTITYNKSTSTANGWVDYIALSLRKRLNIENGFVNFRDTKTVGTGNIAEFSISQASNNTIVWDISDRINAKSIQGTYSSGTYKFKAKSDTLCEYVAFTPSYSFPSPIYSNATDVGAVNNQNLHGLQNADLIIITHPNFMSQANEIKKIHEDNDNMTAIVATPQNIYNEFSSGAPDICAMRNFIKMFYDRATSSNMPKNVLLIGDGSYDNKTSDGSVSNFILTYQTDNSLTNTITIVCDDFFVCLDEGEGEVQSYEKMDMGIGRMPVSTAEEANNAVEKLRSYYSRNSFGNWKNRATIIADDAESNETVHQVNAENMIATQLEYSAQYLNIEKIYLDDYEQVYTSTGNSYPDVNKAIIDNINNGTLLITWVGHGNPKTWAHEAIFSFNSINSLQNKNKYPFIVTATCDYTPYDDHTIQTGGELLFNAVNSGAIGLLSTVRQVYSTKNERLVKNTYKYLFESHLEENAGMKPKTIGECVMLGKNETGDFNMRSFTIIGDPAITLSQPNYSIKTTKINGIPAAEFTDTIGATGLVTIEGSVYDESGNIATNFNGVVYTSVYDKRNTYTTKGNDGYEPLTYTAQRNMIFNGQSTVKNGNFKFSFIVPVDIAYYFDKGKISYYANNLSDKEASGYDKTITIGGTDPNGIHDTEGPAIELYMNDENFIDGGIVNENPMLIAKISDESGINTVGNGIGHDITLTTDGNTSEKTVLNSFYESEMDDYKTGSINYPNSGLAIGSHTMTIKAWDVMNNSTEKSIDFIVTTSSEMVIDKLFNYPNPFTTRTSFYFGHNQPYETLEVIISIFTVSGKLVKTLESTMTCDGYISEPIEWNGLDEYGDKIGKGVYIYKVKVRNSTGTTVEKFEKLVILK